MSDNISRSSIFRSMMKKKAEENEKQHSDIEGNAYINEEHKVSITSEDAWKVVGPCCKNDIER